MEGSSDPVRSIRENVVSTIRRISAPYSARRPATVRSTARGTITWALDEFDQVLPRARVAALPPPQRAQVEEYAYIDAQGNYVLCWDLGRYLNHSCDPSCVSLYDFSMALRDIAPGEQLTDDYSALNLDETFECCCRTPVCRGEVGPDDFLRFADSLYLNFLDGTLDKRLWRGYERTIADTVAYPGFQTWWATRKHWHTDEFCALVDRHIQTATPKIYDGYD